MTFRQAHSAVGLCNRALSRLANPAITSVDPPAPSNNASQLCHTWYKPTVARLLETHHWGLATRRVEALAAIDSDRSEWLYAFAAPDDMAFPVNFSAWGSGAGVAYYQGLGGLVAQRHGKQMFMLSDRTLYSNLDGPLDYVSFDITEADFTESFANIVELSLAAVLAYPITKNKRLETDLRQQATSAMNFAITANLNTGNHRYGDEPSESERVRGSGIGHVPWDWWPGPR